MARKPKTDSDPKKDPKSLLKKKRGEKETIALEQSFIAALKAVENSPDSEDAWDHLEELADELQRPDEVAELYRKVLDKRLPRDEFVKISQRAVGFHEEWFGDDPDAMSVLFSRIIEIDPDAEWAFERLTLILTVAKKWDLLLSLYDRKLGTTLDPVKRRRLLDDAAHVAKDFADRPELAVDYIKQILTIEPENRQLIASLERLIERLGRWQELIELWRRQIPNLRAGEMRQVRVRIATCFLEKLEDHARALDELRTLLAMSPGFAEGMTLAEQILTAPAASPEVRSGALDLLRTSYETAKQPENVVRILEMGIQSSEGPAWVALHREIGNRLAAMGKDEEAIGHFAMLVRKHPTDAEARESLAQLAQRSRRHDLQAQVLVEAADACDDEALKVPLLIEAATIRRNLLGDAEGAIDLYSRMLDSRKADPMVILSSAHILNDLLAQVGRNEERLAVVERLASIEQSSAVRRSLLGEAARLAQQLGQTDRAIAAWTTRQEAEGIDPETLEALIGLYQATERWDKLVETLRIRADARIIPMQSREDLVRIAGIQAHQLNDPSAAIETWKRIRTEFGEDEQVVAAFDELMAATRQWPELAGFLEGAAAGGHARAVKLMVRLGKIHKTYLGEEKAAARHYADALGIDPSNAEAREGLLELSTRGEGMQEATEALARAYDATDDWKAWIDILDAMVSAQPDPTAKARLLQRGAELQEKRAGDPASAMRSLARALALTPEDVTVEKEFARLAEATRDWALAAQSYRDAAMAATDNPRRAAQLALEQGKILESRLGDAAGALEAYESVFVLDGRLFEALKDAARIAVKAGRWSNAASALVELAAARFYVDADIMTLIESTASDDRAWDTLCSTLASKLDEAGQRLRGDILRDFELKIVEWEKDRRKDLGRAEAALRRATAHGAGHLPTLRQLADLQRHDPGSALVETLLKIDDLTTRNLDALFEAAETALHLKDARLSLATLQKLFVRSTNLWSSSDKAEGEKSVEHCAEWALDQLVALYAGSGDNMRAVQLLIDGARLPFDKAKARAMRLRAAEIMAEKGERPRAIELYLQIIAETTVSIETIRKVAVLCEQENRATELLALRLRELELTDDPERRLAIRLEISRTSGQFEEKGGRIHSLLANLEDRPGHEPTIEEIAQILLQRGHYERLADILTQQARKLEEAGGGEKAAALWTRVAALAEKHLRDGERAAAAHVRVVELACTNEALDALARLAVERNDPAAAASWLERRLETAGEKERVPILLRLARARLQADLWSKAVETLEKAFGEAPRNAEVRKLLLDIYRKHENWEALARVYTTAAEHISDEATILAYAREAFQLHTTRLGTPQGCVKVLEKAVSLDPEDRELRRMFAEALFHAGRFDDAREHAEELIRIFGRRRNPDRAGVHLLRARIAHAQGEMDEALEHMETAAKMDPGNVIILKALAELARETGKLEQAELAYRTLLLSVRRQQADQAPAGQIGQSEVLMELSRIASDRGQEEQASELKESAIEAVTQNEAEAPILQANLRDHRDFELLQRVLTTRLSHAQTPRRKSRIMAEYAELLGTALGKPEEAFDLHLRAIEIDPTGRQHHESIHALGVSLKKLDVYTSRMEKLLEKTRRDADAHIRCELLLRLGEVMEKDEKNLDRASEYYEQAEKTGVREVDVWRAQARVAGALGMVDQQMRLLNLLASMGEQQTETRANALYSLAEIQLAQEESLEEGLQALKKALGEDPRYERAGIILGRASETYPGNVDIMGLYEQVARKSGDDRRMLHFLEQRVARADATPEEAREATDLAIKLEAWDRAESLMLRAVKIGEEIIGDLGRVSWALLGLAGRRGKAGDLAGAVKWLKQARDVANADEVFALAKDVAGLASGPEGDLTLVASLYESLLEKHRTSRAAWEPLAGIYARLGDLDRLQVLIDETLDSLSDPGDRSALRLQQARALMDIPDRVDEAVESLRTILLENPEHEEAQDMLTRYFEKAGREDDLIDLLQNNLYVAQNRKDAAGIKVLTMRLGKRLEKKRPDDAASLYRSSLEWLKDDRDILEGLLKVLGPEHDPKERAELMERMLASETGDRASRLAFKLEGIYLSLEDEESALRALELGYRGAPGDQKLFERLENIYSSRGNFGELARKLVESAEQKEDKTQAVEILLKAARIYRENINDSSAAMETLRKASELSPDDLGLAVELAACMKAAGESTQAVDRITSILESVPPPDLRLRLLGMRAEIYGGMSRDDLALADLEEAYLLDKAVARDMQAVLKRMAAAAAERGDAEGERTVTLRYADLQLEQGSREEGRSLLESWTLRHPKDLEALRRIREIDLIDENWEGVASACQQLTQLEEGDELVESILMMARSYKRLERMSDARACLEHAYRNQPDNREIRAELRKIYELLGTWKELAALLQHESQTIEDKDEKVAVLRRAGELLIRGGEATEAIPILESILSLEPEDYQSTAVLADAYMGAGQLEAADLILDEAISEAKGRRTPELALLQHRKARVSGARGIRDEQIEWLQQAFKTDRNNGLIAAELADLAESMQNWDVAVNALRNIPLIKGDCPISKTEAYLRQGKISLKLGDIQRAVFWAKKAVKEDPDSLDAATFLKELGEG